jgi:type IV pilus assembly protein PilO
MNKIQLTNDQLTKIAGGLLFAVLFGYVYTVYFWLPTSKTIAENDKKNAAMESDIAKALAQRAKCPDLEATLAALKLEKEAAQQKLPRERQLPDLLKTLTTLSAKYKVNINSINPSGLTKGEYFMKAAYQIAATGDYHAIGRFLSALGLEVRIMAVENLNLTGTPDGDTSAAASFTLIAYQYSAK